MLLPAAFRSLSRPSSPRYSKAFTLNPYSLDHIIVHPNNASLNAPFGGVPFQKHSITKPAFASNCMEFLNETPNLKIAFSNNFVEFCSAKLQNKTRRVLLPIPLYVKELCIRGSSPLLEIRGLEPLTSSLQSWRSSQLSYIPVCSELYPNKKGLGEEVPKSLKRFWYRSLLRKLHANNVLTQFEMRSLLRKLHAITRKNN